jgi:predicted DNA binding protein
MTTPCIISDRKHVYSVIGSQDNISKFIEQMKDYGKIQNISIKNAAYDKYDILSVLTKKQKEILIAAQKYGYYDYPKKITSQSLSKKVNISRATLVQHLRKAEGRILAEIIAGHDS